ncbi:MAG: class I SAM-dependent methyltransferase [Candidatus Odinarchaeota archaeon]
MPHIFNPENIKVLEDPERESFLSTILFVKIIKEVLHEEKRNIACEIGAGTGYFTIPLARLFKKVYATDLSLEMLNYLKNKAEEKKIQNIVFIQTDKPPRIDEYIDLILFSNVLHELNNLEEYIKWASAKTNIIVDIDWKKENTPGGPPLKDRISLEDAVKILVKHGFKVKNYNIYPYHYFLIGVKNTK